MTSTSDDRLRGWKEIGDFLHACDRTAQRWERQLHLPVHRIDTSRSVIVFASRKEIDAWLETAEGKRARSETGQTSTSEGAVLESQPQPAHGRLPGSETGLYTETVDEANTQTCAATCSGESIVAQPIQPTRDDPVRIPPKSRAHLRVTLALVSFVCVASALAAFLKGDGTHAGVRNVSEKSAVTSVSPSANQTFFVALTIADGRIVTLGILDGTIGRCRLPNRSTIAFSAKLSVDALTVQAYRVTGNDETGAPKLTWTAEWNLKPSASQSAEQIGGLKTIEWTKTLPAVAGSVHR